MIEADPWLAPWLPRICGLSPRAPVLELGCGGGRDTATLRAAGLAVVAVDIARPSLQRAAEQARGAAVVQLDLGEPLPFRTASFRVVVASLSLHYFSWRRTTGAVDEIVRCLLPGGLLLARFNSTKDVNHGAGVGHEIEPHLSGSGRARSVSSTRRTWGGC